MIDIIDELTTPSLERLAASLEARLIHGTASARDVELYMRVQMTLGERAVGTLALAASQPPHDGIDPRD
jgi:hypothetical protein